MINVTSRIEDRLAAKRSANESKYATLVNATDTGGDWLDALLAAGAAIGIGPDVVADDVKAVERLRELSVVNPPDTVAYMGRMSDLSAKAEGLRVVAAEATREAERLSSELAEISWKLNTEREAFEKAQRDAATIKANNPRAFGAN